MENGNKMKGYSQYEYFDTKTEAEAWRKDTTRHILCGAIELSKDITFSVACHRYLTEVGSNKKDWRWEKVRINKFLDEGLGSAW